ncbi:MAG: hypothetical protein AB7O91_02650 [Sphingomonas sp.]
MLDRLIGNFRARMVESWDDDPKAAATAAFDATAVMLGSILNETVRIRQLLEAKKDN